MSERVIDEGGPSAVEAKPRVRAYTSDAIDVTYEAARCIHAAECIKRLHAVFDTGKRPWIQPDAAPADDLAATITYCPSGALHYQRKDGGAPEAVPTQNTIRLMKNGPLYLRGDFTIVNGSGEWVAQDTRAALCRCGGSANKPFCDNTHRAIGFIAPTTVAGPQTSVTGRADDGPLCVETETNGPLHLTGHFSVVDEHGAIVYQGTDETFCRCGGSAHKPFCDGTHAKIGFVAE
jgi:CDGSH-type Zn-finger protein/uncharacterized Fe-S cluster protein YjdI